MQKSKSLVQYRRNVPVKRAKGNSSLGWVIVAVVLTGIVVYLLVRKKTSIGTQYKNEESWDISYSVDGLPTKIVIHRDARQTT